MTTTAGWTEAKGSGNKATLWGGWTTYPAMEGDNTAGGNRSRTRGRRGHLEQSPVGRSSS
jgi:hypothetical protein